MKKHFGIFFFLGILFFSVFQQSCVDDRFSEDPSLNLRFSTDTLFFDTLFTDIGSSTAQIKVYNPHNKNIKIAAIGLAKGAQSPYRMNLDGEINANNQFKDVEIRAKDSLFIFVDAMIHPLPSDEPILMKDSIVFLTNGNYQDVKLLSYGQNVEVLRNKIILNDTTLTNTKPYLIFGDLIVDSAKTLKIQPGSRFYLHDKANIVVYGNILAEGTRENPILFRGDRTDQIFEDVPYNFVSNQWGSIILLNKQGVHKFNFVQINSGYAGIFFQNQDRNFTPTLEITNSRIHNFLKWGLVVQNGNVIVSNSEISNTGSYSVYLNGGKHTFIHCTVANYFNNANVLLQPSGKEGNSAVMIMELNRIIPMETSFQNCVISGNNTNELEILSRHASIYNGSFKNSYVHNSKPDPIPPMFQNVIWSSANDTVFVNTIFNRKEKKYYNFGLDSVSPARNIADYEVATLFKYDLNGQNRLADGKPDAGAYEWQPTKK